MSWDTTTPPDTESVRNGASRIRELKTDLLAALTAEGIFPGSDVTNPVFRWKPNYGATGSRPGSPTTGQLYVNATLGVIERYNGASWDAIATVTPAGTVAVFYQAAAPTGWTQVVTSNDAVLRVVSDGSGGTTGGADSISSPPSHTHTITGTQTFSAVNNAGYNPVTPPITASSVVAFSPKYINVVICSKN